MKNKLFLFLIILSFFTMKSSAQSMGSSYETAVGIKFWPAAVSVKHFFSDDVAVEGLLNFWDRGFRVTGLYEIHGAISDIEGFRWYVGPGAHIGVYNDNYYHGHQYNNGALSLGVDGVAGVEYKFKGAPIQVSADIQPYLELLTHPYIDVWGGVGVRYTF